MKTIDQITINADPDLIFRTAADVERWPEILPHYRWVRVTEERGDYRIVRMAARRGRIPESWTAVQRLERESRRVYYRHIGGATKGMEVEWVIEEREGAALVTIIHDLTLSTPIVRSPAGKWVVANVFISYIAGRTLQGMKETLEQERMTGCGEP